MMLKVLSFFVAFILAAYGQVDTDYAYNKYKFAFSNKDSGAHSRSEVSNAPGHVSGKYQYVDPNGLLRVIQYKSSPDVGFQAFGYGIPRYETAFNILHTQQVPQVIEASDTKSITTGASSDEVPQIVSDDSTPKSSNIEQMNTAENGTNVSNDEFLVEVSDTVATETANSNLTDVSSSNKALLPKNKKQSDRKRFPFNNQRYAYPPLFPYGLYRAPFSYVPFVTFPHSLPFVNPGFPYLL